MAFEQQGVPDAAPRAAVVGLGNPRPAAGDRPPTAAPEPPRAANPALTKTLAYNVESFQDPAARKTMGYEQSDFVAPSPSAGAPTPAPGAAPLAPPGAAPLAPPGAAPLAPPAAAPLAPPAGAVDADPLSFAATVGVADAGFQDTQAVGAATMPVGVAPAAGMSMGVRSTILPHVELAGQDLRLTRQDRLRYEPVGSLGEGGVGFVEKANDNDIGRAVAVKRLHPHQQGPSVIVRFVDEIRTIGQLEHPNIVPIHDVGLDAQGEYYFVMKYVDGETLETLIDRLAGGDQAAHRAYPFERRVDIFRDILEAIRFAHSRGIIHRDIKPANVMVGRYGEVVVMDWGLAKRVGESTAGAVDAARAAAVGAEGSAADGATQAAGGAPAGSGPTAATTPRGLSRPAIGAGSAVALQTQLGAVLGTPAYMSPEQARGEQLDVRSDVYSLCLTLHELLCLRHPLADKQTLDQVIQAVIQEPVPMTGSVRSPHQSPPPMDLSWFVRKGLHKDPAKRYQSVSEMIERLQLRSRGIIPIQCHLTFTKRVTGIAIRLSERFPMLFSLAMLLGLVAVIGGLVRVLSP